MQVLVVSPTNDDDDVRRSDRDRDVALPPPGDGYDGPRRNKRPRRVGPSRRDDAGDSADDGAGDRRESASRDQGKHSPVPTVALLDDAGLPVAAPSNHRHRGGVFAGGSPPRGGGAHGSASRRRRNTRPASTRISNWYPSTASGGENVDLGAGSAGNECLSGNGPHREIDGNAFCGPSDNSSDSEASAGRRPKRARRSMRQSRLPFGWRPAKRHDAPAVTAVPPSAAAAATTPSTTGGNLIVDVTPDQARQRAAAVARKLAGGFVATEGEMSPPAAAVGHRAVRASIVVDSAGGGEMSPVNIEPADRPRAHNKPRRERRRRRWQFQ